MNPFFKDIDPLIKSKKIKTSILLLILACFSNCNNRVDSTQLLDLAETVEPYFTITDTDSSLQLQFFNTSLSDLHLIGIELNGRKSRYRIDSGELITMPIDSIMLGKNKFSVIYGNGDEKDTLLKYYLHRPELGFNVIKTYPHNPNYFTEGLVFDDKGFLLESMGLEHRSKVVVYERGTTGAFRIKDSIKNNENEFGEGIALLGEQLVQLLWKNRYMKIYDRKEMRLIRNIDYPNEGWGLCSDGNTLYASDGTNVISMLDIRSNPVKVIGVIRVEDEKGAVSRINELEYVNGFLFANIWQSNLVYVIDAKNGAVVGKIDFNQLADEEKAMNGIIDVLNGIAYDRLSGNLIITGKYWRNFYEISLTGFLSGIL